MNSKFKILNTAVLIACCSYVATSQAALPTSDVALSIATGSTFGMEVSPGFILPTNITSNNGILVGTAQAASGSHTGAPNGTESPDIDNPWQFFGNTGMHQTTSIVTILSDDGAGNVTLDFSGWNVTWNGIAGIPMGSGAWEGNPDGVAIMTCASACEYGDTFTIDYSATVPVGDPSGFGNVAYNLNVSGTVLSTLSPPTVSNFTIHALTSTAETINLLPYTNDENSTPGTDDNIDVAATTVTNPSCGTNTNNVDGTVTFPVCADGTYTFNYSMVNLQAAVSTPATVTVIVSGTPLPNAYPDEATTNGNTAVIVDVVTNDTSTAGAIDATTVAVAGAAAHGSTSVDAITGAITYTANAGFSGTETFTYTVNDGVATSDATAVSVLVNAMNVPSSPNTFTPGATAQAAGSTTGIVTADEIGITDREQNKFDVVTLVQGCIGGCFDFVISGLANGGTAQVVLPLSAAIPTAATGNDLVYRKLNVSTGKWSSFDRSNGNSINTAAGTVAGTDIICPPASDPSYDANPGLNPGHRCVRLSIVDGGANDSDGVADGTVVDPGGIAEITRTRISSTDGCSMNGNSASLLERADWMLLVGFLIWMGLVVRRKQA